MVDINSSRAFGSTGMTAQQYLASVIQGEAASPEGQFAVASVIQNRTNLSTGGFGDTALETASQGAGTLSPQFSGFNPNYSSNAYSLAGQLVNGNLSDSGDTGNALFYNAHGTNPNYDTGSSIIGGNSFSNRFNQTPDANYNAPIYNASTSGAFTPTQQAQNSIQDAEQDKYDYSNSPPLSYQDQAANARQDVAQDAPDYTANSGKSGGISDQSVGQQNIDASGNSVGYASADQNAANLKAAGLNADGTPIASSATDASVSAGTPSTAAGFGQAGAGALPGPLGSLMGGQTADAGQSSQSFGSVISGMFEMVGATAVSSGDQGIANATVTGDKAVAKSTQAVADTSAKNTEAIDKTNTANTAATDQTNATDTNSFLYTFRNLFVRGWIAFFGLVLLAGAVFYFMRSHQSTVNTIVDRVGKVAEA